MFKKNIKIAVFGLFIVLSLAPAELCAMQYLANTHPQSSSIAKPSWSLSKSSLVTFAKRSFDTSNFFVRNHPLLTIGTIGLISLGVVGYYSGFFSGSGGKTGETKKEQMTFYKKGIDVTKQSINKIAILCALPAIFTLQADEFTDLSTTLDKVVGESGKNIESKKEPEKKEENIVEKKCQSSRTF